MYYAAVMAKNTITTTTHRHAANAVYIDTIVSAHAHLVHLSIATEIHVEAVLGTQAIVDVIASGALVEIVQTDPDVIAIGIQIHALVVLALIG